MSAPNPKMLLIQAQLKEFASKLDIDNPMADVKDALTKLTAVLQSSRGNKVMTNDNEASLVLMRVMVEHDPSAPVEFRTSLAEVDEVRDLQMQLFEQLGNALARAHEVRAHVALANSTMSKLMKTVTRHVDNAVAREAAQPAPPAGRATPGKVGTALRVQVHTPGLAVFEHTFDQDVVKVGKLPTSHLKLEDDNVSRMHAVIERIKAEDKSFEWYVIDLGSPSGTIVNDRKVNKAKLHVGDSMLFGGVNVRVL